MAGRDGAEKNGPEKKVAIVTGASQGIGAGIAAAFRAAGYAVVGTALSVEPSATPDVVMLPGDIAQAETSELVIRKRVSRGLATLRERLEEPS